MDFEKMYPDLHLTATSDDSYVTNFGNKFRRTGKVFSCTIWRTQIGNEIFWSVQGCSNGSNWIVTQYFGPPEEARRFQQEIILHHPTEKKIKLFYSSTLKAGQNCIKMSKEIIHHFKNKDNTFNFEFRLVKVKRKPFPQRTL